MEKNVQVLTAIVRELIIEVGNLKERVNALENMPDSGREEERAVENPILLEGESYQNLGRIYHEGYHICPVAYGQKRDEECLFCLAYLEKE